MNVLDKFALKRVNKIVNNAEENTVSTRNMDAFVDFFRNLNTNENGSNLSECTYLTCIKTLYETIGKLNFDILIDRDEGTERIKSHELNKILRYRPNPHMTPTTFKQIIEFNRNHYGNAYAYIKRNQGTGKLESLIPLNPRGVRVLVDEDNILGFGDLVVYRVQNMKTGENIIIHEKDMLHFKFSLMADNGLVGRSVQEVLAQTMSGAKASQAFLNNLYQQGMTASAILEYTADLSDERIEKLRERIEKLGTGSINAGRILPLPPGSKLNTLDLKLTDSQYFELKKYSALQIASVFGIKPTQINDYEKSSYATSEAQNLSFYVDTILAILRQYEEEMIYKLISEEDVEKGVHIKANVSSMLRADLKTQSEILSSYVNNGIMTPNEARDKLDLIKKESADILMANGNYIPLEKVGNQYE